MGLLSKIKSVGGIIKNKAATAISAIRKAPAVNAVKAGSTANKLTALSSLKGAGPLGVTIGAASYLRSKGATIPQIGTKVAKKSLNMWGITKPKSGIVKPSAPAKTSSTASKVAKVAAAAAVVGAVAYGVEQLAEKAGVRDGAGFIGSRPKKAKKRKSKKKSRSSNTYRRRRTRKTSRRSRRTRRRRSSYGTERQYKRKGGLNVKYTKKGQPYVIQRNGRARFIKRSRR